MLLAHLDKLVPDKEARKKIWKESMIDKTLLYYASDIIHELDTVCDSKIIAKNIWRWISLDAHNQRAMTFEQFARAYASLNRANASCAEWDAYKGIVDKLLEEIRSREEAYAE